MAGPETESELRSDSECIALFEDAFTNRLENFLGLTQKLRKAVQYAAQGGGKRIRPLLCMRAAQAVGGSVESALDPAIAVELIHTFSLVHDDLPAMDDDDLRRGRPTLHKHTNEAMAILAGDVMVSMAISVLAQMEDPDQAKKCVEQLASCTTSMISGQVYDTMGDVPDEFDDMTRLRLIHTFKTGALIQAAVGLGVIVGGGTEQHLTKLLGYAGALGLMFQAVDDLLDVTQSTEQMGKATGKDADAGKLTYPGLLGIDGTRAEVERLREAAIGALAGFDAAADPLRQIADKLAVRQR